MTPAQKQALAGAVERGDDVAIESIVIAAIARASNKASEIVKDAVRIAPDRAPTLVAAIQSVFPNLGDRAETAANNMLAQIEAGQPIAGAEPRPLGPSPEKTGTEAAPPEGEADAEPEEVAETAVEEHRWSGELSLGGNLRTGVRKAVGAHFGTKLEHEYGGWENRIDANFDYNTSNGRTNTHRFQTRGKSKRLLNDRLYAFGLVGYEDDRFSGFDYQLSEAAGLGYRIVDTDSFTWDLEAGPAWRQSRTTETGEFLTEIFIRGGSDFTWTISDTAEFTNETSVLYSGDKVEARTATSSYLFQDSNDLSNVSALDMTVIGNLAARLSCEIGYTSEPPPGGTKTQTLSKIALVQSF